MVYEVSAADIPKLTPYGWNVFQSYGLRTTNKYSPYVSVVSANGVTAMAAIPYSESNKVKLAWPQDRATAWIRDLAVNAGVAWWDLPEEMRPWVTNDMKLLQDYTAWTRLSDPQRRPTYEYTPNTRTAAQLAAIVPGADVLGVSCYCEDVQMPHAWVRYKIEESGLHGIALAGATVGKDYLAGQKTSIAVLYCAKNPRTGSMPSPDQTYHDFWSAIVSGAKGIGVFAYFHAMRDDPSLAENFRRLDEAASQISGPEGIGEAILDGMPVQGARFEILSGPKKTVSFHPAHEKKEFCYPSLHVLVLTNNGAVLVLAVNSTDQTVNARIAGLPSTATSALLPFENREIALSKNGFTDSFPPWGVHLYRLK